MTIDLSDRSRSIVTDSLPLMEQHRTAIEEALGRHAARRVRGDPSGVRTDLAVRAIADLLYGHVRKLAGIAEPAQHRHTSALGAEHVSSFGDALKPVMRDVLGAKATPSVIAAWGDAFWAIVRKRLGEESRLAA